MNKFKEYIYNSKYKCDKDINISKNEECITSYIKLRHYQKKYIRIAISIIEKNKCCFLYLRTGFGKSITMIDICSKIINEQKLKGYVIIIDNDLDNLQQIKNTIEDITDQDCMFFKGKLKKDKKFDVRFIVCTSIMSKKLSKDLVKNNCSILVLDEIDTQCTSKRISSILRINPQYLIGMSATKERYDGKDKFIDLLFGKNIITCPFPPVNIKFIYCDVEVEVYGRDYRQKYQKYLENISKNDERNRFLYKLIYNIFEKKIKIYKILNIEYNKIKIMIFTERILHIKNLIELLYNKFKKNYEILDLTYTKLKNKNYDFDKIINSFIITKIIENENGDKIKIKRRISTLIGDTVRYYESDILITNPKKAGRGFDESSYCDEHSGDEFNIQIRASSVRSDPRHIQICGRMLRTDLPTIIHVIDGNSYSQNHYNSNIESYEKRDMISSIEEMNVSF
uniref:A18-like helicase n=1 Tax=Pithovirus LCDPAC02 TaxID=2506601 RepID=A0A481YNX3_9VIRU|nr:MAG: A18-like helicase [Pithovirus LCDPAC02]